MLVLPQTVRIPLAVGPADLRRSFNGLAAMAREVVREDTLSAISSCSRIGGGTG